MAYTEMEPLAKVFIDTATQRQRNKGALLSFMEDFKNIHCLDYWIQVNSRIRACGTRAVQLRKKMTPAILLNGMQKELKYTQHVYSGLGSLCQPKKRERQRGQANWSHKIRFWKGCGKGEGQVVYSSQSFALHHSAKLSCQHATAKEETGSYLGRKYIKLKVIRGLKITA